MLSKEQVGNLARDFRDSQEFIELAHTCRRELGFVCHHNSYLIAKFLRRLGHQCRWISGYYRTNLPDRQISHSWIVVNLNDTLAIILEFDPRQLYLQAGYQNDLMPNGEILGLTISPPTMIVDPELVEVPAEARDCCEIVFSRDVLGRYVQAWHILPEDINLEELNALYDEVLPYYNERFQG